MSTYDPAADEVTFLADVPASDPVRAIIDSILELVRVSHWSFARFKGNGDEDQLLSSSRSVAELGRLKKQFILQSPRPGVGPSIAPTTAALAPYSNGLSLVFADNRARFGILTLMRTDELGPFSSSEIRSLTFALDAASDRLSELRLMESQDARLAGFRLETSVDSQRERVDGEAAAAHYVLNRDFEIVLAWNSENERRISLTPLEMPVQNRLPPILEEAVRQLTASWTEEPATGGTGIARPLPFLVLRTRPMSGPAGLFIGVTIERSKPARSLTGAAARFSISPREAQVLALLLDGLQLDEIAERLHITSSTIQDHIRGLLEKTDSRNRSEMTAKILGWDHVPDETGTPPP